MAAVKRCVEYIHILHVVEKVQEREREKEKKRKKYREYFECFYMNTNDAVNRPKWNMENGENGCCWIDVSGYKSVYSCQ